MQCKQRLMLAGPLKEKRIPVSPVGPTARRTGTLLVSLRRWDRAPRSGTSSGERVGPRRPAEHPDRAPLARTGRPARLKSANDRLAQSGEADNGAKSNSPAHNRWTSDARYPSVVAPRHHVTRHAKVVKRSRVVHQFGNKSKDWCRQADQTALRMASVRTHQQRLRKRALRITRSSL
jgi:hypothetical protein